MTTTIQLCRQSTPIFESRAKAAQGYARLAPDYPHISVFYVGINPTEKRVRLYKDLINKQLECEIFIPCWALLAIAIDYGVCTLGTICTWWIPYLFGSSKAHKEDFAEYRNTHTPWPARGDNVVPNTLHIILHLQVWTCFGIACYLLIR